MMFLYQVHYLTTVFSNADSFYRGYTVCDNKKFIAYSNAYHLRG